MKLRLCITHNRWHTLTKLKMSFRPLPDSAKHLPQMRRYQSNKDNQELIIYQTQMKSMGNNILIGKELHSCVFLKSACCIMFGMLLNSLYIQLCDHPVS